MEEFGIDQNAIAVDGHLTHEPSLTALCNDLNDTFSDRFSENLDQRRALPVLVFKTRNTEIHAQGYEWIGNAITLNGIRQGFESFKEFHHERGHSLLWSFGRLSEHLRLRNIRQTILDGRPYFNITFERFCEYLFRFCGPTERLNLPELMVDIIGAPSLNGLVRREECERVIDDDVSLYQLSRLLKESLAVAQVLGGFGLKERTDYLSEGFATWFEAKQIAEYNDEATSDSLKRILTVFEDKDIHPHYSFGSSILCFIEEIEGEERVLDIAFKSIDDDQFVKVVKDIPGLEIASDFYKQCKAGTYSGTNAARQALQLINDELG